MNVGVVVCATISGVYILFELGGRLIAAAIVGVSSSECGEPCAVCVKCRGTSCAKMAASW